MKDNDMKIKPILFSTPMVQTIMDDSKTQTRRTIKAKRPEISALLMNIYCGVDVERCKEELIRTAALVQKGDILWVRETYGITETDEIVYRSDFDTKFKFKNFKWKPSIFMPKEACRNFLKVTNVRVELLQDISEEDALAEGIKVYDGLEQFENYAKEGYRFLNSTVDSFESLWIYINGKESWDLNPYVFVYDFEKTERPENFI